MPAVTPSVRRHVDTLREHHHLDGAGYAALLTCRAADADYLREQARCVAVEHFGHGIYVRGLVELTNVCRNDCLYCGIRRSNADIERYILSREQVMACCRVGHDIGFRTFVLQGGELPRHREAWIAELIGAIRAEWPDTAITLSLGEWPREAYAHFRAAGADRYLLRHETHSPSHYAMLHPASMRLSERLECLDSLVELGFQTGTGIMVGSPWQTVDNIVDDIQYIEQLRPHMVGLGPFVPQHSTPLGSHPHGSADITTRLYAIFRLMMPQALIPSTTALSTIDPRGRQMGILAGANVVMPNLSPPDYRSSYALYDGKAATAAEAAEGVAQLQQQLAEIGYHIDWGRGDHCSTTKNALD